MALTYMGLVNNVLTRLNEVNLTSGTFASESGFHAAVREAVNAAIFQINHQQFEWPFNYTSGSQTCTPGTYEYSLPSNCKTVDWETFYVNQDLALARPTQARWLSFMDYPHFRQTKQIDNINGGESARNVPQYVTRTQNTKFAVAPVPDQAYVIKFDYFKLPDKLVNYNDTTSIPDMYEEVILNGAMFYAEQFRQNPEVAAAYHQLFNKGIDDMRIILVPMAPYARDTRFDGGASMSRSGFY